MLRKSCFYVFGVMFVLNLFLNQSARAKEYSIPKIRVEVHILADGSVRVTEYRTYSFDGNFKWADYRLPFKSFTAIKNIRVSENGRPFNNRNDENPGTFEVQRSDNEIAVKWFYRADDVERTFAISYTLKGAIVVGSQWCEFFWNFLSSDREKDTENLQIQMALPQSVSPGMLNTWKRGPRDHINLQNEAGGYLVTATHIAYNQFVKIRAVFPRAVFNQRMISTNDADFSLSQAQANEDTYQKEWAARQKRRARYAGYGQKLAVIIPLLSIIGFAFFYQKYGKRHDPGIHPSESLAIPGNLKPATAGWLLGGRSISSAHLMATLLDLAQRKYFVIEELDSEERWLQKNKRVFGIKKSEAQPTVKLTDWEAELVDFVNQQIDKDNRRIDKLFSESSWSASKWFSDWKKKLKNYCEAKNWYDEQSFTGVYWNLALQIILAGFGVLSAVWAGPVGVIPIGISVVLFAGSAGIIRRTPEGERTYRQWKAYKEALKNADRYAVSAEILGKHFIYAVTFGLSKKNIESLFTACDTSHIVFYWFIFHGNQPPAAEIANTFSTLTATGTSAFPGASGGAGASAGAAGGGAAGGAG